MTENTQPSLLSAEQARDLIGQGVPAEIINTQLANIDTEIRAAALLGKTHIIQDIGANLKLLTAVKDILEEHGYSVETVYDGTALSIQW